MRVPLAPRCATPSATPPRQRSPRGRGRRDRARGPAAARLASICLGGLLLAAGCRVGHDYEAPDLSARTEAPYEAPSGAQITAERERLAGWWERFDSPELSSLAERLCRQNLSLAEARQRVVAARARRGSSAAGRSPQLEAGAGYSAAGTGDEGLNFQGPPPGTEVELYSTSLSAVWELDLWGRVERLVEAADAEIGVALEDYRGAAVSLLAELALAYLDASTLESRLRVVNQSIELQQESARLLRSRLAAGNGTRAPLEQAESELELTRARVPELEFARRSALTRIAILIGERPSAELVQAHEPLALPPAVGRGLPADLLTRRTDVRRAERALAARVARIGAAQAERYPSFSIFGTLGLSAREFDTLTSGSDALGYSIGPSLSVPLFTAGRIDSEVRLREADAEAARLAFERTLLEAIGEVENASEGVARTRQRVEHLEAAASSARAGVAHAQQLYDAGLRALPPLVEARRAETSVEELLLVARQAALAQTIDLYRALGGGWETLAIDGSLSLAAQARAEPLDTNVEEAGTEGDAR